VRVELYRPSPAEGEPESVVAIAAWRDARASIEVVDPSVPGLNDLLRPTAVAVDDPSLRALGTSGEALLQPGDRAWFMAAVTARGRALGLGVRALPDGGPGGWDPASQYRRFDQQVEKLARERS
jgi:hypothetical protein